MKWKKLGLIFEPTGQFDWLVTHAAIPFAERIDSDLYRIYFCGRDKLNRAQVGYIELNHNNPLEILHITEKPVLGLGLLGTFDNSGVMPSWIISQGDSKYMYYTGWTRGSTVPYYFYIGLAISHDEGKSFERATLAPILERNDIDPYLTASPCIRVENGKWRMWYVSGVKRETENDEVQTYYNIKYAESRDGIHWDRNGITCIDFEDGNETRIARPCVLRDDDIYKMWYCYAIDSYTIGYAESDDGIHWIRKDKEVGIRVSDSGWDSKMICYPFVFKHKGRTYMLYNGNEYGKAGFGYAVLVDN